MELNLERPLVFFDIESTGLNIATDSIVELCFVKVYPGESEPKVKTWRVCPWDYVKKCQNPINPSASEVTGIKDEDVAGEPKFSEIVDEAVEWLRDSDLAGFNSAKFDLPLLVEEIERVKAYTGKKIDIDLHKVRMVDVQTIFHKMEPRNLSAAYRFYCKSEGFDNAHAAEADTLATYEVLKGQLSRYENGGDNNPTAMKNDVEWLANFSSFKKSVDFAGRLAYNAEGEVVITFGKHKDKLAKDVFKTEPSYFAWIDQGDFTLDTKMQFRKIREEVEAERKAAKKPAEKPRPLSDEELLNAFGFSQKKLF